MKPAVTKAIEDIQSSFASHRVESHEDGEGGAFVRVHDLPFGDSHEPSAGWVTFHIVFTYPAADIYPHYFPAELCRRDGQKLGEAFHKQEMKLGPFIGQATMVSRKSNRWNPAQDTAALKLAKVLDWGRSR